MLGSDFDVESVLVAERFAETFDRLSADRAPVYVADEQALAGIVGFDFHRGVLGCGRRRAAMTLEALMAPLDRSGGVTLVICPQVADGENLGSILRISAAFGVDGVVLGPRCCDAFSRRALRVSMGAAFVLPVVESSNLPEALRLLAEQWNVELAGAVLDEQAQPLSNFARGRRLALLFGSEADGLPEDILSLCGHRLTIPMAPGTDSLNLAVAAGIFIHAATRPPTGNP